MRRRPWALSCVIGRELRPHRFFDEVFCFSREQRFFMFELDHSGHARKRFPVAVSLRRILALSNALLVASASGQVLVTVFT